MGRNAEIRFSGEGSYWPSCWLGHHGCWKGKQGFRSAILLLEERGCLAWLGANRIYPQRVSKKGIHPNWASLHDETKTLRGCNSPKRFWRNAVQGSRRRSLFDSHVWTSNSSNVYGWSSRRPRPATKIRRNQRKLQKRGWRPWKRYTRNI